MAHDTDGPAHRARVRPLPVLGAVAALSVAALAFLPWPFVWLAVLWSLFCFVVAWDSRRRFVRVVLINAGLVVLAVGGIETLFATLLTRRDRREAHYPPGYFQLDDDYGGAPTKNTSAHIQKWHDSTLVYDVTYSFGPNGLRLSPPDRGSDAKACALFFSDSFMLGEGLNDDQTLPWRVGVLTGGAVRVANFGFHGFGAQQMLVAFDHGRVAAATSCRVTNVVYLAIPDHVARASGLAWFTRHSPRYDVIPDGHGGDSVLYHGHFDDAYRPGSSSAAVERQLLKSWLYRWASYLERPADDDDLRRYLAIVAATERIARAQYPGCRFDVLWWGMHVGNPLDEVVLPALQKAGFHVHLVEDILPEFKERPSSWLLSPYDAHPSARADDLLARYLAREILAMPVPDTVR